MFDGGCELEKSNVARSNSLGKTGKKEPGEHQMHTSANRKSK